MPLLLHTQEAMVFDPKIEHLRKMKIVVKERAFQKNMEEKTKALKVRHMKIVATVIQS